MRVVSTVFAVNKAVLSVLLVIAWHLSAYHCLAHAQTTSFKIGKQDKLSTRALQLLNPLKILHCMRVISTVFAVNKAVLLFVVACHVSEYHCFAHAQTKS